MSATTQFLQQRHGTAPQTQQQRERKAAAAAWQSLSASLLEALPQEAGYYAQNYSPWTAGQTYNPGQLLQHQGVALQVRQAVTAQAHQPPFSQGMTAIYVPLVVPDEYGIKPYKYGCATGQGERFYGEDGKVYVHIGADNPSNIYPPSGELPSIWQPEEGAA